MTFSDDMIIIMIISIPQGEREEAIRLLATVSIHFGERWQRRVRAGRAWSNQLQTDIGYKVSIALNHD